MGCKQCLPKVPKSTVSAELGLAEMGVKEAWVWNYFGYLWLRSNYAKMRIEQNHFHTPSLNQKSLSSKLEILNEFLNINILIS